MIYKMEMGMSKDKDNLGNCQYLRKRLDSFYVYTNKFKDSALTRIKFHTSEGLMIISAEKPIGSFLEESETTTLEEHAKNVLERSKQLERDIRDKGLGFISTFGEWPNKKRSEEELSYIVPFKSSQMSEEEFFNFAIHLTKKYEQDGVLLVLPHLTDNIPMYINIKKIINNIHENSENDKNLCRLGMDKILKDYYKRLKKDVNVNNVYFENRLKTTTSVAKTARDSKKPLFASKDSLYEYLGSRCYRTYTSMSSSVVASRSGEIMHFTNK